MNQFELSPTRIKFVGFCILILLFGIFLGMNSTPTTVWIFGWNPRLPLIAIALFCFIVGCACGWGMSVFSRKKGGMEEEV